MYEYCYVNFPTYFQLKSTQYENSVSRIRNNTNSCLTVCALLQYFDFYRLLWYKSKLKHQHCKENIIDKNEALYGI